MKNLQTLFASVTLAAAFATPAFAAPKTIQIGLDGLVCAFCAQGVEKKMKAQAATDKVFVSLDKKVAVVALKDGQDIPDATIKAEITDAGYVVKSIARSEETFDALTKKIKASK
ncbi:MAG: heavy-metal-associated domain-containing protein [Rhodocyclaceae bacterium]|nr:heavy-metal-associated domain-containing protein [Rhodocyclaceae bacterium]